MGGGVMDPILCYGPTQVYTYLRRKLSRSQSGGVRVQYTPVYTNVYLDPLPLRHSAAYLTSSPRRRSPRDGNATT